MRFMMLMIPKGYETAPPGRPCRPANAVSAMMKYNEALQEAGVLIALDGLHPPSMGARVSFAGGKPVVTDGPFTEAKEVLGGYWMIEVKSREEAIAWAKRCPASDNEIIEIRQVQEIGGFLRRGAAGRGRICRDAGRGGRLTGVNVCRSLPLVTFAAGSCKSLSHELAQGTTPRRARLSSRQSERGAAAGGARADRRKGRGRLHLRRCRAHGRRQPGRALPAFPRPRRTAVHRSPSAASSSSRRR